MRTRWITIIAAASLLSTAAATQGNPLGNGGFEELGPDGRPVGWQYLGGCSVTADAYSGQHGLRIQREAGDEMETGLNRAWAPNSGEQDAMLAQTQGGVVFHYKGVSANGAGLRLVAIPMNAEPWEVSGERAVFEIPREHIGDGQWHEGRLKYDYSEHPDVKWVHIGARIAGKAGEMVLDDMRYVEAVGPILQIGAIRIMEDDTRPGCAGSAEVTAQNAGDQPVTGLTLSYALTVGEDAATGDLALGDLAPDDSVTRRIPLELPRTGPGRLRVTAASNEVSAEGAIALRPELEIVSFGPVSPLAEPGQPFGIECQMRNTGHAMVQGLETAFMCADTELRAGPASLAPGVSETLRVELACGAGEGAEAVRLACSGRHIETQPLESEVTFVPPVSIPPQESSAYATVTDAYALAGNQRCRLIFPKMADGFGPAWLEAEVDGSWKRVAALPKLGRLVYIDSRGQRRAHEGFHAGAIVSPGAMLELRTELRGANGAAWDVRAAFSAAPADSAIEVSYSASCGGPAKLAAFDGPMLYALDRTEALYPGLEWLVDDEASSSALDIAEGHEHQIRYVAHPNMITIPAMCVLSQDAAVALLWDPHQAWNKAGDDRPTAVFASPDRFNNQRAHLMGLQLPAVPDYLSVNHRTAETPYPMAAGERLTLTCAIGVDQREPDILSGIDAWFARYGVPEPAPLPRGSYPQEYQFSLRGYLEGLWNDEAGMWWLTKNGPPEMSGLALPPSYVADLLLGTQQAGTNAAVVMRAREKAKALSERLDVPPRRSYLRYQGSAIASIVQADRAAGLLAAREEDGAWYFDPSVPGEGVFEGMDYHELGARRQAELGTCAANARTVLRLARITGDLDLYERMRSTLEFMERFRVPRAAQVWEVPVHTPDILAAAEAVEAYLEAYAISGESRWLDNARFWARRGLPFVYFWQDEDLPFLLGASIPVFGASWNQWSWFGRPVQWNGLRYARAILALDPHDDSYPWRRIAETIIVSTLYQQASSGEDVALWPDSISAIDGSKSAWVFGPRMIYELFEEFHRRYEHPQTRMVRVSEGVIPVTAVAAPVNAAQLEGDALTCESDFPEGEDGYVFIANVTKPAGVVLNGEPVPEGQDLERTETPLWAYHGGYALVVVRCVSSGPTAVELQGVAYRGGSRLPEQRSAIDFDFDDATQGWFMSNDLGQADVKDGVLRVRTTGPDPYMNRGLLDVDAANCPGVDVRMRVDADTTAQFFWSTYEEQTLSEARKVEFPVKGGVFHTYRLDVGAHPGWQGKRIQSIRLDPVSGGGDVLVELDSVRGVSGDGGA